jgi:hypothetical protein
MAYRRALYWTLPSSPQFSDSRIPLERLLLQRLLLMTLSQLIRVGAWGTKNAERFVDRNGGGPTMRAAHYRLPLALFIASTLAACGLTAAQRDAAGRFSSAAVDVGDFAANTFPAMRQSAIEMNTSDVILRGHAPADHLDQHFDLDKVEPRVAAAQALSNYGKLLRALVEETQAEEIKKASDNFVASVRNVPGKKLSDQQYEALGTVVQGVGGMIVEAKKAHAVKEIVPQAQDDVDKLCDLLSEDFDRRKVHLAQGLDVTRIRLASDADLALTSTSGSSAERALAAQGVQQAAAADATLTVLDAQGKDTVQALKKANAALAAAVQEQSYSLEDLKSLSQQVQGLAAAVRTLAGK